MVVLSNTFLLMLTFHVHGKENSWFQQWRIHEEDILNYIKGAFGQFNMTITLLVKRSTTQPYNVALEERLQNDHMYILSVLSTWNRYDIQFHNIISQLSTRRAVEIKLYCVFYPSCVVDSLISSLLRSWKFIGTWKSWSASETEQGI